MQGTEKYECVVVDRDVTPELAKKFSVNSYPSILILNTDQQLIHRWSGFSPTAYFVSQLEEGLVRFERSRKGERWDAPPPRAGSVSDQGSVRTIPAPAPEGVVLGLAVGDGEIWVSHSKTLHRIDLERPDDPKAGGTWKIPGMSFANGLALDGDTLYLLPYSWRDSRGIRRFDTKTRTFHEKLIVPAPFRTGRQRSTTGIAVRAGRMFVLQRTKMVQSTSDIIEIDLASGEEIGRQRVVLEGHNVLSVSGLHHDGKHLYTTVSAQELSKLDPLSRRSGSRDKGVPSVHAILAIDPKTGRVTGRIPIHYSMRSMAVGESGVYYLGEQPAWYFDRHHRRIQFPAKALVHILDVRPRSSQGKPR